MKFYEFNNHTIYALIQANTLFKACEIYSNTVDYDDIEELLEDGIPNQISALEAFIKVGQQSIKNNMNYTIDEVLSLISNCNNYPIITGDYIFDRGEG